MTIRDRCAALLLAAMVAVTGCDAGPSADMDERDEAAAPFQLGTLLSRAVERDPQGELVVLGELPAPASVESRAVENRHDPSITDTIRTLRYAGVQIEVYRVSANGREMIQTVRVTGDAYATDEGLRVGTSRSHVRELRGQPPRVDDGTWVYEVQDGPDDPTPTMLHIAFDGDRVASLSWHYYVD